MRGYSYAEKGDYARAIADFTEAIHLNPKRVDFYNNRGCAYNEKGDHDKAVADYTEAIHLDPKAAAVYYNRGNAYSEKGDKAMAKADFAQAKKLVRKQGLFNLLTLFSLQIRSISRQISSVVGCILKNAEPVPVQECPCPMTVREAKSDATDAEIAAEPQSDPAETGANRE